MTCLPPAYFAGDGVSFQAAGPLHQLPSQPWELGQQLGQNDTSGSQNLESPGKNTNAWVPPSVMLIQWIWGGAPNLGSF